MERQCEMPSTAQREITVVAVDCVALAVLKRSKLSFGERGVAHPVSRRKMGGVWMFLGMRYSR